MRIIAYHGTSEENAKLIEAEGFKPDLKNNWAVKSKSGFVYLSTAYSLFYAMKTNSKRLALIKCEVDSKDAYPEDDFIMTALGKPRYTQEELDKVNLIFYKRYWKESLKHMGNIGAKPKKIKILGIRYFEDRHLLLRCDPVVSPINFKFCGDYYKKLTEWIFEGKDCMSFPAMFVMNESVIKDATKRNIV